MNWMAIDGALDAIQEVPIPKSTDKYADISPVVPEGAGDFADNIMDPVLRLKGDSIPVSMMPINGAIPTGTKKLERKGKPGNPMKWVGKLPFVAECNTEEPYFEHPGSCLGCGETPYIHTVTQMFGDRMIIANATGCTSIYGGTFPSTPYTKDSNGKGPAWANSLFEDNAEYGFGMRLAVDANRQQLKTNVNRLLVMDIDETLLKALQRTMHLWTEVTEEAKLAAEEVKALLPAALENASEETKPLLAKIIELKDYFVDKSVWIFGGDGWAYDIGFGGLDHVMASDKNVNLLVLDTEVYSNTGGQASKSTPRGAVAKFAADGKKQSKKNLGLMMASYENAYVASVNMGENREQTALALAEAEKHNGPSLVIAYSPCIAHGYDMKLNKKQSEKATHSGYWPMYRFNPELRRDGLTPFIWETAEKDESFEHYIGNEIRYRTLQRSNPEEAKRLLKLAEEDNKRRFEDLQHLKDE
jgi:pyruvate-ferredoxin/flavodoxin oxidoreductase